MKTTINVGSKTLELANNAFTPILYRQIFKKDFLALFSSMITKNKDVINKALKLQSVKAEILRDRVRFERLVDRRRESRSYVGDSFYNGKTSRDRGSIKAYTAYVT